jgi:hypothetical protein
LYVILLSTNELCFVNASIAGDMQNASSAQKLLARTYYDFSIGRGGSL